MGEEQAKIHALNKIVSIIDEKASIYKNERKSMPSARAIAEKKTDFRFNRRRNETR